MTVGAVTEGSLVEEEKASGQHVGSFHTRQGGWMGVVIVSIRDLQLIVLNVSSEAQGSCMSLKHF